MQELFSIVSDGENKEKINLNLTSQNNKEYKISIRTELNSLSIVAKEIKNNKEYNELYFTDDLKNNSKYFLLFDKIKEKFEEMKDKIYKTEPSVFEESNSLKLVLNTGHTKYKEIIFNLPEKKTDVVENIDKLVLIVEKLAEIGKNQTELINDLKENNKKLQNEIKDLKVKNQQFETKIEELNDKINNNDRFIRNDDFHNNNYNKHNNNHRNSKKPTDESSIKSLLNILCNKRKSDLSVESIDFSLENNKNKKKKI